MDIFWGLLGGGIIGLLIALFYYKKSKKEDEKQLDSIKKEFENLDKKVSRINIDNLPIEEQEELKNEKNKKSDLLRPYIIKVLDNIDNIINSLNKTRKDITWEKPQLPANIYDSNISTKFKFNKIDRESIEEKDLMKQNAVRFKLLINLICTLK